MQFPSSRAQWLRYAIFALCVVVLLFAVKAKMSQYEGLAPHSPVVSAKLWVDGEKMELRTVAPVFSLVFWIVAAIVLLTTKAPRLPELAPAPPRDRLFELHRFLRPPPAL